jgi:hypothetical protein
MRRFTVALRKALGRKVGRRHRRPGGAFLSSTAKLYS